MIKSRSQFKENVVRCSKRFWYMFCYQLQVLPSSTYYMFSIKLADGKEEALMTLKTGGRRRMVSSFHCKQSCFQLLTKLFSVTVKPAAVLKRAPVAGKALNVHFPMVNINALAALIQQIQRLLRLKLMNEQIQSFKTVFRRLGF